MTAEQPKRLNIKPVNLGGAKMVTPPKRIASARPQHNVEQPAQEPAKQFEVVQGQRRNAWKIGIYGEPGVGKSTLASLCNGAIFADIEGSMLDLNVSTVAGIEQWEDLRAWVKQQRGAGIYGIDSMSKAEDMCADYVIRTKVKDGEMAINSIEDFKYGAGAKFVSDEFRLLLGDIDKSFSTGVCWIMVAHNRVEWYKNPDDKDFMLNNPDLLDTKRGSCRADWIRFCDHIAFVAKDVAVVRGKAQGGGTRTIYMDGGASRVSKQRGLSQEVIAWSIDDTTLWDILGITKGGKNE